MVSERVIQRSQFSSIAVPPVHSDTSNITSAKRNKGRLPVAPGAVPLVSKGLKAEMYTMRTRYSRVARR